MILKLLTSFLVYFTFSHAAFADASHSQAQQQSSLPILTMLVVFGLFIYFAVWRPQSKRAKEQQTLLNRLTKGDEVMTAGGLLGRITKLTDQYIGLAISNDVEITIQKTSVMSILPKGTLGAIE